MFYVLIAVALLAALAYAIAQSGRGSVVTLSDDKAKLYATEIIAFGGVMTNAVAQLRLRGYKDTQISFENPIVSGYVNSNCTSDACKVFHLSGAGVTYTPPKAVWLDPAKSASTGYGVYYFTGRSCVAEVGAGSYSPACNSNGEDDEELLMILPYVDKNLCVKINDLVGVDNVIGDPPQEYMNSFNVSVDKFIGSYSGGYAIGAALTEEASNLNGHRAGCFEGAGTPPAGTYHFYQVLEPR